MLANGRKAELHTNILRGVLPILASAVPLAMLYMFYPDSFEATWKGRTYYLFFLFLLFLETLMSSSMKPKDSQSDTYMSLSSRTFFTLIALTLPTIYVAAANWFGLDAVITNASGLNGVPFPSLMPLSTEYLVLTALFALVISLNYGIRRMADFSMSIFFLGTIGFIYTIDNLYPYERFTPFQIIVPTTTNLAVFLLNLMGYRTFSYINPPNTPMLKIWDAYGHESATFGIAWPCSGVESLIIYTIVMLLFLRWNPISLKAKIGYFAVGATVTYFINALRIATIFIISVQGGDIGMFHLYYGQLYSIAWITSYPLIVIGTRILWNKVKSRQENAKNTPKNPGRSAGFSSPS